MSVPKILHACFLGSWQFNDLNKRCHESWNTHLLDYSLHTWRAEDITIPNSPWLEEAFRVKPINAVSYLRYWTLWTYGGVALDNDMEILRPLDECLEHGAFLGFQKDDSDYMCLNYSILGAEKGHPWLREMLDYMEQCPPDDSPLRYCNVLLTDTMKARGMTGLEEQKVGDIMIYGKERFYPWFHDQKPDMSKVTDKTFAIHHWEASWKKENI